MSWTVAHFSDSEISNPTPCALDRSSGGPAPLECFRNVRNRDLHLHSEQVASVDLLEGYPTICDRRFDATDDSALEAGARTISMPEKRAPANPDQSRM